MCGIAGIVHADPDHPVPQKLVRAMCDAMAHRGPDDFGEFMNGCAHLGMRRLSIIDLHTGKQPLCNEDKTLWVVFNGEIYNYRQLRDDLASRGHKFATTSDTEVILHAYEEFGQTFVQSLRGMFAFALWDIRSLRLILGRDRLGIKPLYYSRIPEGLVFASELKALLIHPSVHRDIDAGAVTEYFRHLCVPGEQSIFRGIRKLLPAHLLVLENGNIRLDRYWDVQPEPEPNVTAEQWTEALREKLQEVVASHLVADVPVGAFLSGGLDSGAMVALMAKASPEPVQTFTVGFRMPFGGLDERVPARAVAHRYSTVHQECLLDADIADILPGVVHALDEPFADSSTIPTWLVCRETARHVKVALSGLGGDELFGGYERYVGLLLGERFRRLPAPVRHVLRAILACLSRRNGSANQHDRLRRFIRGAELSTPERYRSFITAFANVADILQPDVLSSLESALPRYDQVIHELRFQHPLDLALFADLRLYLPDDLLTLTDRVSMAHSLEVRVPYLDHQLIEFVARIPATLKVSGFKRKWILRRAVAPLLPQSHFKLPKRGFSVPMAEWLRGPLRTTLLDLAHSQAVQQSPWFRASAVQRLVNEHLEETSNHEVRLWGLICFLEWHRHYSAPVSITS